MTDEQRVILLAAIAAYCDLHELEYEYFYNDIESLWVFDNETHIISPYTGQVNVTDSYTGQVTMGDSKPVDNYLKSKMKPVIKALLPLVKKKR